jgi:4-amino-4-deoxy-L-arabinose transferase-like glycosyltransferase
MNSPSRSVIVGLFGLFVLVFFFGLGKAQLFEPDEGRNAEIARETLVTGDWVTPHNDFLPALDKPMPYYWLVAASYKAFGISEWSARLPSALAALGCLFLIYRFSLQLWGVRAALWSALIWATSIEVFVLARVVILDMALTLCISLALYAFYLALHSADDAARRRNYCLMYAGIALGVLIKGPIAAIIPAMTIGMFLLLTKRLRFVGQMHWLSGLLIFLTMVIPWYLWAEARNPGYLKYFLWEEHVVRFLTPHFGRREPWYYFFLILPAGFFPWSLVLPAVIKDLRADWRDERKLFLILWAILPFVFFSLSSGKLPHYILPIFPPLALLTGEAMSGYTSRAGVKSIWMVMPPWLVQFLLVLCLSVIVWWPGMLPPAFREIEEKIASLLWQFKIVSLAILALGVSAGLHFYRKPLEPISLPHYAAVMILFPLIMVYGMAGASRFRSAKEFAHGARRFATQTTQYVVFETYLCGLPFYLRVTEPIWIVWSGAKSNIMGSWYVAEKQPPSARGKVLFTFEEFAEEWRNPAQPLLVYVKDKNLSHLASSEPPVAKPLFNVNGYDLVTNR